MPIQTFTNETGAKICFVIGRDKEAALSIAVRHDAAGRRARVRPAGHRRDSKPHACLNTLYSLGPDA